MNTQSNGSHSQTTGKFQSEVQTLDDKHLQEWLSSAVNQDIIERNVWSIDDPRELDQLLNRNTERRWRHSNHLVPG